MKSRIIHLRADKRLTPARVVCYILVLIAAYLAASAWSADATEPGWSLTMPACFHLILEDQRLGPQQNPPLEAGFGTQPRVGDIYDLTESDVPDGWRREWEVLRVIHLHGPVGAKIWVQ